MRINLDCTRSDVYTIKLGAEVSHLILLLILITFLNKGHKENLVDCILDKPYFLHQKLILRQRLNKGNNNTPWLILLTNLTDKGSLLKEQRKLTYKLIQDW